MPLATLKAPWGRMHRFLTVKLWPKAGCNAAAHSRVKTIRIRPTWRPLLIRLHNNSIKNSFQGVKERVKRSPTWRRPFHQQADGPSSYGAHTKDRTLKYQTRTNVPLSPLTHPPPPLHHHHPPSPSFPP